MALNDTQLAQLINQLVQDNNEEDITPADMRDVLLEIVRAKINQAQLEGYAQLASPAFSGVPQVPTAPAGTATNQVASTGFVQQALAFLAGSRNLSELLLPQAVVAGNWYVTLAGLWEPRRSFTAAADPAPGPNWRQVASFTGPAVTITADGITDASPAGRRLLTAPSAAAQRALLGNPSIVANQYGDSHPGFSTEDGPEGLFAWVIKSLLAVKAVKQPDAPTNGLVNDVSKEFSFTVNPAYPSYLQYLAGGLPGSTGPVALSTANAYQVSTTVYVKVGAAVAKGNLGVYVAGSGNVPSGKVLVNDEAFTGASATTETLIILDVQADDTLTITAVTAS
ncbi:MAG: hypothetical protein ACRYFK_16695 [Janthinobacterium lividum]